MRGSPRWSRRGSGSTPTATALLIRAMPELKARAHDLNQLAEGAAFLFAARPLAIDDKAAALLTDEARGHLARGPRRRWPPSRHGTMIRPMLQCGRLPKRLGLKLGKLAQPLRAALTGKTTSPGIFDVLALLGQRRKPGADRRSNAGAERMTDTDRQHRPPRAATSPIRLLDGSVGPDVIDIRKLYAETGMFTYDPGFTSTASLPERDHLHRRRRGHPAPPRLSDRPARRAIVASWKSPTCCSTATCRARPKLDEFIYTITRHTMVHEQLATFYRGFRRDAHPMAIMCGVVGALSRFLP